MTLFPERLSLLAETLMAVTTWYTGDEANLAEVEDYNKRSEDHLLEIGDEILIPQKLIRRTKKMPLGPFR